MAQTEALDVACPSCDAVEFDGEQVVPGLSTHACRGCGLLISTIERSTPARSEFELANQDAYLRAVGAVRRIQAVAIIEALRSHGIAGGRLLDVGCSFGFFLVEARAAGFDATGIEPDRQAYEHAAALVGDGRVQHGLFDGTFDGQVDVVATLDVVEHIPPEQHATFAGDVHRALRPGGLWVVKVPSTEGLYYRLSLALARVWPRVGATFIRRMWQTEYEYPHLVYFDLHTLSRWLRRFGFDVVSRHYLPEVPPRTAVERLITDGRIPLWQARVLAPILYAVHIVERLRRRSDALVVVARAR